MTHILVVKKKKDQTPRLRYLVSVPFGRHYLLFLWLLFPKLTLSVKLREKNVSMSRWHPCANVTPTRDVIITTRQITWVFCLFAFVRLGWFEGRRHCGLYEVLSWTHSHHGNASKTICRSVLFWVLTTKTGFYSILICHTYLPNFLF